MLIIGTAGAPCTSDVRSLAQAVLTKVKFILLKAKVLWLCKFF